MSKFGNITQLGNGNINGNNNQNNNNKIINNYNSADKNNDAVAVLGIAVFAIPMLLTWLYLANIETIHFYIQITTIAAVFPLLISMLILNSKGELGSEYINQIGFSLFIACMIYLGINYLYSIIPNDLIALAKYNNFGDFIITLYNEKYTQAISYFAVIFLISIGLLAQIVSSLNHLFYALANKDRTGIFYMAYLSTKHFSVEKVTFFHIPALTSLSFLTLYWLNFS